MRNTPASSTFLAQWPLSAKLSPSVYRIPLVLRPLASPIQCFPQLQPYSYQMPSDHDPTARPATTIPFCMSYPQECSSPQISCCGLES